MGSSLCWGEGEREVGEAVSAGIDLVAKRGGHGSEVAPGTHLFV